MKTGKKFFIKLAAVILLAGIAFSIFVIWDRYNAGKKATDVQDNLTFQNGNILGEEEAVNRNIFSSDNFRAYHISLEGGAIMFPRDEQPVAPEIQNLRSELLTTKNEKDLKFVISWKTNKPCVSSIEYKREGESKTKIFSEEKFGYVHSAQISPLNFSTTYSYQLKIKDKWGEETNSEKMAFYTGAPSVSIFDLLGSAFGDMFGWANKK